MKKLLSISLIVALCIILLSVFADAETKKYVADYAGLLTSDEADSLNNTLKSKSDYMDLDIVFVTVNGDYSDYVDTDPSTLAELADDYFDYNGYGRGDDYSGALLIIDISKRDYYISTCGFATYIYGDATLNRFCNYLDNYVATDDYYGAVEFFADFTYSQYSQADYGDYVSSTTFISLSDILWALGIGFVISLIIVNSIKNKMTVHQSDNATQYIDGNLNLTRATELYMYSHTTRTRRAQSSNGSRGGSTHSSSSGRSHGGGGRHF